jgi:N-methylhydantoinase B/oxoprolinase/acetone carboxylase alpha subunit
VARDVKNGKVSLEKAREDYGVALDGDTLEVDEEATVEARKQISGIGHPRTLQAD